MKVLVTGGNGPIRFTLCENLLAKGYHVVCVQPAGISQQNFILPLFCLFPLTFNLINCDLSRIDDCRKALDGSMYVFHDVDSGNMLNLLIASRDAGVIRFVCYHSFLRIDMKILNQFLPDSANQVFILSKGNRMSYNQLIGSLQQSDFTAETK